MAEYQEQYGTNQYRMAIEEIKGSLDYGVSDYIDEPSLEVGLYAMEKQIPKKPISFGGRTDYKCSVCGRRVRSGKGSSSRIRDNFCQRCGQALDWSDSK